MKSHPFREFINPQRYARSVWVAVCVAAFGLTLLSVAVATDAPDMNKARPSDQSDPFPITVKVEPSLVVVYEGESGKAGRKVTVSGRTMAMGPGSTTPVSIRFESDDPPVHSETDAAVENDGSYSNSEFGAVEPGEYTVTATAPDGRGIATTTLTVIAAPDVGETVATAMEESITAVDETLDTLEKHVEDKPDTPAKEEAQKKIASLRSAHKAFEQTDPVAAIHGFFGEIRTRDALLEKQVPKMRETAQAAAKLEETTAQLKRMNAELGAGDVMCETMALALETAKLVSTVVSFEAKLSAQLAGMAKDVIADAASNRAKQVHPNDASNAGYAGGLIVKYGKDIVKGEAVIDDAKGAGAFAADFAAFMIEKVFDAYCKRFVGPVEGTFSGKFYRMWHGERVNWWKQSYKLSGRILLRYPKNATGKHIQMTGRIEGYAHSFDSWDDGMNAFDDAGIMKGSVVATLHYLPFDIKGAAGAKMMSQGSGLFSAQTWGSVVGMAMPNSFAMKVRGELQGDTISVLIGDRITDFSAKTRVVNVIVSPLNTLGPTVVWYPLPFVDGHSVIAGAADDMPIDLKVSTQGKTMTAKGKVDHMEDTEHARGEYHLDFKLCNPGC